MTNTQPDPTKSSKQALIDELRGRVQGIKNIYDDEYDSVRKISYGRHMAFEDCRESVLDLLTHLTKLETEETNVKS